MTTGRKRGIAIGEQSDDIKFVAPKRQGKKKKPRKSRRTK